ncbi:MAG TPA: PIN domain-containing protein [Acidobacteriota bacterium]|nr:PIN domain-containing protein [Acidobacteriota bacterium]
MPEIAYLDTSLLCALAFAEESSGTLKRLLTNYDGVVSSNLLEAEFRAALEREKGSSVEADRWLGLVEWILPPHPLSQKIALILEVGYSKGSDLWHLACALDAFPKPEEVTFATLDRRQWQVAKELGFQMLPQALEALPE